MNKFNLITALIALALIVSAGEKSPKDNGQNLYPNELEGFKLYSKYCSGLEPMKSEINDVKKILGEQIKDKSGLFVLWYDKDDWHILVYLCSGNGRYPSWQAGKTVETIDFIPVGCIPFKDKVFSDKFNRYKQQAADAAWNEFSDAYGLVYEVYISKPPYSNKQPGDLDRISYRASPQNVIRLQRSHIDRLLNEKTEKKNRQKIRF